MTASRQVLQSKEKDINHHLTEDEIVKLLSNGHLYFNLRARCPFIHDVLEVTLFFTMYYRLQLRPLQKVRSLLLLL